MKKKRKVLSLWATILLVVGALLAILGITALVVYLTRSEEKEKVYPQSITAELVSGSLGYQVGSNFYVSDEFEMVINGDSEEITEKSVTLSFNNEVTPQNGYISNGRIRLPQKVTLGRKFEVELVSVPNSAVGENVVVGGFSQIKARSANTNLTPTNLGIYVDVPVYDFQAGIIKGDTLDESGQVVVGDVFQIGAKFTPADSQKVYNNAAELKEIFIEPTKSSHIKIDYATKKIEALRPLDSNEQPDEIVVYTFLNGYYRNLALERVAAKGIDKDNPAQFQQFNNEVLAFFRDQERNNVVAYESDTLQIDIKQVNIEPNKFILNVETASDIRFDKYYTLYMANGGNNLGISLKDTAGNEQYNLYSGVGIKLPSEDYISITGGRVVRVVKNDDDYSIESISYTEYLEEKKNNTYLGASYYILPDTSQPDSRDYFWKFDVSQPEGVEVSEFNLTVNFFYNKGGELTNLLSFEEEIDKNLSERSLKLEMDRVTVEVQPIWKGREAIDLVLAYDKDGKLEPADVDLSLMITKTETNVYDKVVFFLLRNGKGDGDDQEFNDAFPNLGGRFYKFSYDGVTPQEIAIYNTDPYRVEGGDSKGYYLYELQGSSLQALKSYSKDVVKVIAATVKTRADGSLYYDEDGAYKIVKYSQPLEVNASSTLSITNMTPTFEIDTTEDGETDIVDENYYIVDENAYVIPAIIRNKAGAPKDVIKFYLEIGDDDIEETKVRNANLSIRCYINGEPLLVDGLTEELLRMSRLTKIEDDPEGRNIYTANLVIEEQLVNRLHSKIETVPHVNIDNGIKLDLRLVYNDGEKDSEPKQVKCRTEGKETASIILYYPKPTSAGNLKVGYKDSKYADETIEALVDAETPIDVSVTSKSTGNEDGINISWGSLTGLTIEDLNNYLTCTLVDQYGRNVNDNIGVYRLEFYETDEKGQPQNLISLQDQNKKIGSFLSTSGETKKAKLSVKIRDILLDEFVKDAAGNDISSPEVNFNITSQGVTHIEVDTNKTVGEYDFKASQTSNKLEVRKIVTGNVQDAAGNAEIILNNIIKVWLDNSWEDQDKKEQSKVTDLIFTLSTNNSFVSSDLLNVIAFYSGTDALTEADLFTKNIEKISLNYAINRNIPLQFNISNETGIIQLSLTLILLPDVTLTPNFNGIEGREYLVSQDLAAGVFGGTSYDLKDIINVSFNDGTTQSDTRYTNWEEYGIANSDDGDGILSIKNGELAIANVYRLTQASLTIYYGNKAFSQYALQVSIMVYVNPNYIIVQNSQDLDLNSLSSATFTDNHKIYSALDYIKENGEVSELEEIKLENIIKGAGDSFAFNFKSANNQLLQLDNSVDNIGKYRFNSNWTDPLNMPLGQREKQTFNINFKIGDSEYFFHAFKKVGSGNIEKPDSTKAFTFDDYMTIGDDPTQLLIVSDNISEKIATVVYNGEKRLILKSGVTYKPASSNVTIDAMSSKIASSLANNNFQVKADITNFVDFADNNNIRFTKTIADSADSKAKTIAVSTTLKVIISREVGDRFVKYSNSQNYNEYKYSNEKFADFSEFFRSDSTQIAEKFEAGREYTILYNTPPETTGGDKYAGLGFYSAYYDEAHLANHKVEIVQGQQYGRVEGNKLTIYHLENSVKDAYILLRLTITDTTIGTISWYYRIEVEPSFTAGEANYPFTSEGEYLDADSDYYKESEKGSEYEIQVDKTFSEKNSKFTEREDKTRFIDPKLNEGFSENKFVAENERYRIGRILNSTGQEIQQDSISCVFTNAAGESNENNIGDSTHNILHISGVANQVVTIELIKYFVDKNDTIPGSEIVYLLRFNQGQNYRIELSGFKDKQGFENTEVSGNGTNYKSQIVLPETDKGTYLYGLNISEVNGNLENSLSGDSVTAFAYSESSDVTVNSLSSSEDEPAGEGTLKVGYYFGYDEDSKQFKLTIKLAGTIAEDKVLKIAFFTAQRRALMLEVTITKQIKLDVEEILNKNLYVGETYKFVGEDGMTAW